MANPFVSLSSRADTVTSKQLTPLAEYGYDFETNQFTYDENGNHITVTENEALKVWIYKALRTERYRYLAYHDDYGITIEPYQGTMPNTVYTADRIRQHIREGLSVNPYIKRINEISVEKRERDDLFIYVDITSVYSEDSLVVTAERSLT